MTAFAELGGKLKQVYGRWSLYADMAARFLAAFIVYLWIRRVTGGASVLFSLPVLLAAAALVVILSANMTVYPAVVFLAAAAFEKGLDIGAASCAILLVLWLLFLRFAPDDARYAVFLPILMFLGFTPLVPLYCGIRRKPIAAFAMIPGVVFYQLAAAVSGTAGALPAFDGSNFAERLRIFLASAFTMETAVMVIAVTAALLLTYIIRRMALDYAFYIAPIAGGILYLVCLLAGNAAAGTEFGLAAALVGTAASVFVMIIYLMLFLPLNFAKSEQLRFEDDDFYYYVKAVPKYVSPDEGEEDDTEEETLADDDLEERLASRLSDIDYE